MDGRGRLRWWLLATLLIGACTPAVPGQPPGPAGRGTATTSSTRPKHLTIAIQREPTGFIDMASAGSGSTGGAMNVVYIAQNGLMVQVDVNNRWRPQLALEAPSIEKGSWVVYPDGTMDVTWKLHSNVKWHDLDP